MISSIIPTNEAKNAEVSANGSKTENLFEKSLDELALLASRIFEVPIAALHFMDGISLRYNTSTGLKVREVSVENLLSLFSILQSENVIQVPDTRKDERLGNHLLVADEPGILFYASAPIRASDGMAAGTLILMDHQPRRLNPAQLEIMKLLATHSSSLVELRREAKCLENTLRGLEERNAGMEVFCHQAAHHLKSPLCTISMMTELFREQYSGQMDEEGVELLETINEATSQLAREVDEILNTRSKN